jgi:hypothetical protein
MKRPLNYPSNQVLLFDGEQGVVLTIADDGTRRIKTATSAIVDSAFVDDDDTELE